jgi:hypothetical protein
MDMGKTSSKIEKAFDVTSRRDFLYPIVAGMVSAVVLPQPMAAAVVNEEWTGYWRCFLIRGGGPNDSDVSISDLEDMRLQYNGGGLDGEVENKGGSVNHIIGVTAEGALNIVRHVREGGCETRLSGKITLVNHNRLQWHLWYSDGACNFSSINEIRTFNRVREE